MGALIETFIEEIEPAVTQKDEFEYQGNSLLDAFLEYSDHLEFSARNKSGTISTNWYAKNSGCSVRISIEEFSLVFTDENDSENRDESLIIAFCGLFEL